MKRGLTFAISSLLLAACTGVGHVPRPLTGVAVSAQRTATVSLRLPVAPGDRQLQAIDASSKARITIEAQDMATPVVRNLDLATPNAALTVSEVPVGDMRVFTLDYLDAEGKAPNGMSYAAYKDIIPGSNRLSLSDVSTVYSRVYLAWMRGLTQGGKVPADAGVIETVVDDTLRAFNVPSPRLLNTQAIAVALSEGQVTTKNLPTPKAEWVLKSGSVLVSIVDTPTGLPVEFRVDDLISAPVVSSRGEPVLLGPIAPREAPYKLIVRPMGSDLGPDLAALNFDVSVSQEKPLQRFPSVSLAKSAAGEPLPEDIGGDKGDLGGGMGISLGTTQDNVWMIGGWIQPRTNPVSLDAVAPQPRLRRASRALRYTRANKWTLANPLPDEFPRWGAGVAVHDQSVFVFGGQVDGVGSNRVYQLNTATPEAAATWVATGSLQLSECVAAKLNDKIYVAGGYETVNLPLGETRNDSFEGMWVFNPVSRAFEADRTGETGLLASPAGVVLNNVWYTFGGWSPNGVSAQVRSFDGAAWSDRAPMPTARSHAAAAVLDGKIWVIGGEEKRSVPSRAVEVYDPVSNKWQRRAPLRHPRTLPVCGVVKNAAGAPRIVVAGGVTGVDAEVYGVPLRRDTVEELVP